MNVVSLIGRITREPELRRTNSGKPVVSFTLAVDNRYKDSGADFISCVAWDKLAEIIAQYVHKGHRIAVGGSLQTRTYESKGVKHNVTEVVLSGLDLLEKKEKKEESKEEPSFEKLEDEDSGCLPF